MKWGDVAVPSTLPQVSQVPQGVCPVSEDGAVGWGSALAGARRVSVRLGGRWHLQRRPATLPVLPVLRRALCSARAPSRVSFAWVLWRAGGALWRGRGYLAGWVATNGADKSLPLLSHPLCAAHPTLACALLASCFAWVLRRGEWVLQRGALCSPP